MAACICRALSGLKEWEKPRTINTDKAPAYGVAIAALKAVGAITHFELRPISERARDGIAAARAEGKPPGRQPLDGRKAGAALKLVAASVSPTRPRRGSGLHVRLGTG